MKKVFKIFRYDPQHDKSPHYDTFHINAEPKARILDCLNDIRWHHDDSLAYRMSCGHGICGSDGMMINGEAHLACQQLVQYYAESPEIIIEPLPFFPIIRDLVVDLTAFFQLMRVINPENGPTEAISQERHQTISQRQIIEDALKCILCACCSASCPVLLNEDPQFIGPAALLRGFRYIFDSRTTNVQNQLDDLQNAHGIWSCKTFFNCTKACPKKIRVTEAILQTKQKLLRPSS